MSYWLVIDVKTRVVDVIGFSTVCVREREKEKRRKGEKELIKDINNGSAEN